MLFNITLLSMEFVSIISIGTNYGWKFDDSKMRKVNKVAIKFKRAKSWCKPQNFPRGKNILDCGIMLMVSKWLMLWVTVLSTFDVHGCGLFMKIEGGLVSTMFWPHFESTNIENLIQNEWSFQLLSFTSSPFCTFTALFPKAPSDIHIMYKV